MQGGTSEPIFNVPRAVLLVLGLMAALHAARYVMQPDTEEWFVLALAFIPARYAGYSGQLPGGSVSAVTSFLTHAFVHGNLMHLAFNSAWLLAFGSAVAKRVGPARFLAFFAFTAVVGATLFLVLNPGLPAPMVGASGAVAGLMGATMRFLFAAIDSGGVRQLRENPASVPLMRLADALRDRRILLATAIWLLLNVLATFGLGTEGAPGAIAWEAHIGGFLAGLFCYGLFDVQVRNDECAKPSQQ